MTFDLPSTLTSDELAEIAYLNGIDANGNAAATSYWSDLAWYPHKWQNDGGNSATVGEGGGVVTYAFDASAIGAQPWGDDQKASFVSALTLWSDIANISFQEVASGGDVTFFNNDGDYESDSIYVQGDTVEKIAPGYAGVHIYTDPSTFDFFGDITSFSTYGGYGVGVVTHELGHLLGLGHGGPYNGSADPVTQQYTVYDDRLYSVMSYIDTFNAYYTNADTAAADWGQTADGGWRETSYTPMALDILAAQQLYGASVQAASPTGAYRGGQIFGFNCNITDASKQFFDFNVDTAPIVTLFDYGRNNTLDLSGYGVTISNVINLNQGAFSSVGGLTNNLCIAYNTHIETAIGGAGDDTFYVNADADHIIGGGGTDKVVFSGLRANYTIAYSSSGVTITDTSSATPLAYTLTNIQTAQFAGGESQTLCFLAGTRIRTPAGEVAIETLRPGDLVLTAQGEAKPMLWLGTLAVSARFANPQRSFPIRIKAGALGVNVPHRDLLVSPDHALLVEDILVNASALVNGTSILRETAVAEVFVYYHVELDDHSLILAENVPAETFVDNVDRMNFDNWAEHGALFPEGKAVAEMNYPRAKASRQVPPHIRAALERRAEALDLVAARAA